MSDTSLRVERISGVSISGSNPSSVDAFQQALSRELGLANSASQPSASAGTSLLGDVKSAVETGMASENNAMSLIQNLPDRVKAITSGTQGSKGQDLVFNGSQYETRERVAQPSKRTTDASQDEDRDLTARGTTEYFVKSMEEIQRKSSQITQETSRIYPALARFNTYANLAVNGLKGASSVLSGLLRSS